ncbi:MAG: response regulator [Pseudomonadota bacterium]
MHNVLIVDDSASMRQMVGLTLKNAGFSVTEAEDGDVALAVAEQAQTGFELVITDVNMPNMDGITLVRKLREREHYKFCPILVLTTESSQEKKQQGKAAGATGWIVKPFDPTILVNVVHKVLSPI